MAGSNQDGRRQEKVNEGRGRRCGDFYLRSRDLEVNLRELYGVGTMWFSLKVHHGGKFNGFPGRVYRGGKVDKVDLIDGDYFSAHLLDKIAKELGYKPPVYYNFLIPNSDLDIGLMPLGCDSDIQYMIKYVKEHKVIDVYFEHGNTTVGTYYMSPHKEPIRFEELPSDVVVVSPALNRRRNRVNGRGLGSARRLMLEDERETVNETVGAEEPVEDERETVVHEHMVQGDDVHQEPVIQEQVDHSHVVQEPVFENEEMEGDEQQPLVEDGQRDKGKAISTSDSDTDSEDSDYDPPYMDAEHEVNEVEVDMNDFRCNIDPTAEWIPMNYSQTGDTSHHEEGNVAELAFDDPPSEGSSDADGGETNVKMSRRKKIRYPEFSKERDMANPNFYVGQLFASKADVKEAVKVHSVQTRRHLKIIKNDNVRFRVICVGRYPKNREDGGEDVNDEDGNEKNSEDGGENVNDEEETTEPCPWTFHVAKKHDSSTWQVKTYQSEHRCLQSRKIKACTFKYLASQLEEDIKSNPTIPVSAIQEQWQKKLELEISSMKAFRAKTWAHNRVIGDYSHQYAMLRDYSLELQNANPGTTVKIEIEPCPNAADHDRVFKRMYVCLGPLKEGYRASGRELLGLDGAFMKGPYPGQLFSAVAVDSNNGIYPIAYAMVEAETMSSWSWFLECLADDLDLYSNSNYTFISDRQKGLIPALAKVLPCAEHRFCLQHIYQNFKREGFKGLWYKDMIWKAATATTVQDYDKAMDEIKKMDMKAFEWLTKIKAEHWTRSHFSGRAKCDVLYNNMCESFNKELKPCRDKPIITCFEFIREYLMKHIVAVQKEQAKSHGILCPAISRIFSNIVKQAAQYSVVWNGAEKYQVNGPHTDNVVVDLVQRTCACKKWDLTSMPCKHAVAAIWVHGENGGNGIPENWVDSVYRLDTWKKMYAFKVNPINGPRMWPKSGCPTTLKPPKYHPQAGRPRKARRRDAQEVEDERERARGRPASSVVVGPKLSRSTVTLKCTKCGNPGHNVRTCKGQGGQAQQASTSTAKVKRKNTNEPVRTRPGGPTQQASTSRAKLPVKRKSITEPDQTRPVVGTQQSMVQGTSASNTGENATSASAGGEATRVARSASRARGESASPIVTRGAGRATRLMGGVLFSTHPR